MSHTRRARAAEYRRWAQQARTVAYLVSSGLIRRELLEGARIYDALAEQAEAQERGSRNISPMRDPGSEM